MAINEKQYETILAALADKITEQETTIAVQKWQIEKLEKALAEAEYHLNPVGKKRPETLEIR
jgi:uncharacterized coiled-coil protein SlyX